MTTGDGGEGQRRNREYEERVVLDTRPCYVRYSLRGLGVFSGGLCLVFGFINLFMHLGTWYCIPLSILLAVIGFFVLATEAAGGSVRICHCIFLNKFPKCSGWLERQPLWVKPLGYILFPLISMIFCTTWWTFFGGGMVVFTGAAYIVTLWRKDSTILSNNAPVGTTPPGPIDAQQNAPVQTNRFTKNMNNNSPTATLNSSAPRPTFIDIRQKNNDTSTSSGKSTPNRNPLSSLSNYEDNAKPNNNDRYENISVISLQNETRASSSSNYSNVDLGSGAYPDDNPFVIRNQPVPTVRGKTYDDNTDEHNC